MLDSILNTVKGELAGQLTQQTELGPAKAGEAAELAKDNVLAGLTTQLKGGELGGVLDLFKQGSVPSQNPLVQQIAGRYLNDLITKLGLPSGVAQTVSQLAIPFLLDKVLKRTPNGSDMDQGKLQE
ncbi:MAG: hypothetical protein WBA12_11200, partial [Catalinimonas sp.]